MKVRMQQLVTLMVVVAGTCGQAVLDPVSADKFYQYGYQVEDTLTGIRRAGQLQI